MVSNLDVVNKTSEKDLKELFNKLDKNKDGKIEFNELKDYFSNLKTGDEKQAQLLFDSIRANGVSN